MKVLFDHGDPFLLAHGGFQIQIEQTKAGLAEIGVEVDYLHWWDGRQTADLLHYFGVAPPAYLQLAKRKGIPVVMTSLLTATCNRSDALLQLQGLTVRSILALPAGGGIARPTWRSFGLADLN